MLVGLGTFRCIAVRADCAKACQPKLGHLINEMPRRNLPFLKAAFLRAAAPDGVCHRGAKKGGEKSTQSAILTSRATWRMRPASRDGSMRRWKRAAAGRGRRKVGRSRRGSRRNRRRSCSRTPRQRRTYRRRDRSSQGWQRARDLAGACRLRLHERRPKGRSRSTRRCRDTVGCVGGYPVGSHAPYSTNREGLMRCVRAWCSSSRSYSARSTGSSTLLVGSETGVSLPPGATAGSKLRSWSATL